MWFVGLLIGMILGGIGGSGSWVFVGGILGLAGGLIYTELSRGRNNPLEERVEALEKKVTHLSAQIAALKLAQPPAGQTQTSTGSRPVSTSQLQTAVIAPAAATSVDSPRISPAEKPVFSLAILPVDSPIRG